MSALVWKGICIQEPATRSYQLELKCFQKKSIEATQRPVSKNFNVSEFFLTVSAPEVALRETWYSISAASDTKHLNHPQHLFTTHSRMSVT